MMANDNLSGIVTNFLIMKELEKLSELRHTYRFAFFPETIGALAFLNSHENTKNILGGAIINNTCGSGGYKIKKSFDSQSFLNSTLIEVAKKELNDFVECVPFSPDGSDERQFSKPAFRINTPSLHKSKYYDFWQYHTNADNLEFIDYDACMKIVKTYVEWIRVIDTYCKPKFVEARGEIQLGKRGLYPSIGGSLNQGDGHIDTEEEIDIINWMMHYFDGEITNFEFSKLTRYSLYKVNTVINKLYKSGVLLID